MHAAASSVPLMDATQFDEFAFPGQPLQDDDSMGFLGDPDNVADISSSQRTPATAALAEHRESTPSMATATTTAMGPGLGGISLGLRRQSVAASDDGSHGHRSAQGQASASHAFDDTGTDDFGLSGQGIGDGTDLGGKAKDDGVEITPTWSELKTKAGKERKRLPLACIACRRKKIRCSGEKPACKHCLRSRIPCVYKVTTRKAAPRTDYMAMLDKRLKRMEERIIKIVPVKDRDTSVSSITRAILKPAIPGTAPASKSATKKRTAGETFAFELDLDSWAHGHSKNNMDGPARPTSLRIQEAEENELFRAGQDALPSKDIQEHLAEVFFENVYGQAYHLLHKPSYMRKLRAGTLPPVLILSVCSIAARFSTHPKLNTTPNFLRGEEWACHAREICTTRYEWPNITILTCLLILGLHEFGTCHGGRSWALGGQAIRMAFALQLHKDLEHDPLGQKGASQLSFIDREIRRRTMWSCFLMDRFNSSGTDRPVFIKEENIRIPLPIKEQYFQLDMPAPTETLHGEVPQSELPDEYHLSNARENIGVAAYMIKTISLWGRIISYLNQGGKELDPHPIWSPESQYAKLTAEAEDVSANLPDSLKYNPGNLQLHDTERMANQFLFLHISIQQNILFLNRVAVASPGGPVAKDIPHAFVSKAGAKTYAAANRISDILNDAEQYLVCAPFVGYCAFSSATIHIIGIFSGDPNVENDSKRNLTTNVKFLSKMKRYWGMFHWMSETLRQQYRSCADAARNGGQASDGKPSSPIIQYGDWFDRYPYGVSQSDFLDPATTKDREKGGDGVLEQKPELHTVEEYFTNLSPPHGSEGGNLRDGGGRQPAQKRKSVATGQQPPGKRPSVGQGAQSSRAEQKQQQSQPRLDPLTTDFRKVQASAKQPSQQQQQQPMSAPPAGPSHPRRLSEQLGAQANQPGAGPAGFNPVHNPQSQAGGSYHALSPISPVAVSQQFGHHPQHHHHAAVPASFYSPNLLNMSLNQQANGMLQPLDRQLVFGAYSMDPGPLAMQDQTQQQPELISGLAADWDELTASTGASGGAGKSSGMDGHAGSHGHGHAQHLQQVAPHSDHGGHEASSAWFMPFNMEPPEIGPDMGLKMDGVANMFGGGGRGPGGMGG